MILFYAKNEEGGNPDGRKLRSILLLVARPLKLIRDISSRHFGSDLHGEYTGSKYTNSLKGTRAKAKANASTDIPEQIEIAAGKHIRENQEGKHIRNAKNVWYRYDSRFALPVYDVIDIKKETSNSLGT